MQESVFQGLLSIQYLKIDPSPHITNNIIFVSNHLIGPLNTHPPETHFLVIFLLLLPADGSTNSARYRVASKRIKVFHTFQNFQQFLLLSPLQILDDRYPWVSPLLQYLALHFRFETPKMGPTLQNQSALHQQCISHLLLYFCTSCS
ncbi:MAG: hypothetical protein CM1200mP10_18350 [Candidatus Neomarinimicrobiota bacterium]|nr:MAG: hypothetical protein CM1200mP10_18350 [Candidatus Neomarinimicrobiota bacterium]